MKLINESGTFYLDDNGQRLSLTNRELNLFRQMKPMGRRLLLRKRATDKRLASPDDPEIKLIMRLTKLPSMEWSFNVPD